MSIKYLLLWSFVCFTAVLSGGKRILYQPNTQSGSFGVACSVKEMCYVILTLVDGEYSARTCLKIHSPTSDFNIIYEFSLLIVRICCGSFGFFLACNCKLLVITMLAFYCLNDRVC